MNFLDSNFEKNQEHVLYVTVMVDWYSYNILYLSIIKLAVTNWLFQAPLNHIFQKITPCLVEWSNTLLCLNTKKHFSALCYQKDFSESTFQCFVTNWIFQASLNHMFQKITFCLVECSNTLLCLNTKKHFTVLCYQKDFQNTKHFLNLAPLLTHFSRKNTFQTFFQNTF